MAYYTDFYRRYLIGVGEATIERYDREESGQYDGGAWECERLGGRFNFAALDTEERAAILHALNANLPTHTARISDSGVTSYTIKHAVERYVGFYVSNLQVKTAMRILGYMRGGGGLNPAYNISRREWRLFAEAAADAERHRHEAGRHEAELREHEEGRTSADW